MKESIEQILTDTQYDQNPYFVALRNQEFEFEDFVETQIQFYFAVARQWIPADRMIHYNLHQVLDVKHSADFFAVLQGLWDKSPEDQYYIEQGLRLGAFTFNSLYRDLFAARKRREFRTVFCDHLRD